jgi:uncharacterized damage-inducible protein DinB
LRTGLVRTLFDYNRWANRLVLERAAGLSQAELTGPADVAHGSLLGTLAHILAAEQVWRSRCQEGVSPPGLARPEQYPTLEALAAAWEAEQEAMRSFVDSLSEEDLDRVIEYRRTNGRAYRNPLWQVLVHVVNHGTQHRGEAALLLTRLGRSPGDLDLMRYLRQQGTT